jgi:hypothetical protein
LRHRVEQNEYEDFYCGRDSRDTRRESHGQSSAGLVTMRRRGGRVARYVDEREGVFLGVRIPTNGDSADHP